MLLRIVACSCVLWLLCFSTVPRAEAAISRQNPFRSFNVGGVNYGSQKWERQHRSTKQTKSRGATPRRNFGLRRLR